MEEEETILDRWKAIDAQLADIAKMMVRWRTGKMIRYMDVALFERTVYDRFEMERQLMIATQTIEELSKQVNKNAIVLQHFNESDLKFMRKRIAARLACEAKLKAEEVPEVPSN